MKTSYLTRLGAPALLLGLVAVGCTPGGNKVASLSSVAPKADKQAARRAAEAESAITARNAVKAVAAAEEAVALAPRNAAYRAVLGQAYLIAGRFTSAEASFAEAVALDPTPGRASFNLALSQIALGKWDVARDGLAKLSGIMPDADIGLATALAGDREGALVILERAAREEGAGAKVRQNLALTYALSGRWNDAQTVATQDVPGNLILHRISEWSKFARPESSWDQVASLLGVTPVEDPGRPAALALTDVATTAVAAAEPVVQVAPEMGAQAMALAAEEAAEPAMTAEPAPAAVEIASVESAEMPSEVVAPPLLAAAGRSDDAPLLLAERKPVRTAVSRVATAPQVGGKWVVQLGAFAQPQAVNAAWTHLSGRVAGMRGYAPARSTFMMAGSGTLHRLAVSGFATRLDAQRMCVRVKAHGGNCFVRPAAGEQPIHYAAPSGTLLAMR
jgi:Flp pilus assembly protein TadD/cell division septation protein DedD